MSIDSAKCSTVPTLTTNLTFFAAQLLAGNFTCDQNNMAQKGTLLSYFKKVPKTTEQSPATPKNVLKAKNNKKTSPTGSSGAKKGEHLYQTK